MLALQKRSFNKRNWNNDSEKAPFQDFIYKLGI